MTLSFVKSFIVSLVALMALNSVIMIITYAVGYGFDNFTSSITNIPLFILYMLFSSTGHAIWAIISVFTYSFEADPFNWSYFIVFLGFIIAPLIAAIITGLVSEKKTHAFGAFFLSVIICMLICIILVYQGTYYELQFGITMNQTEALITVTLGSLVNGLIYGIIAFLTTKQ